MVPIRMMDPVAANPQLADASMADPAKRYFEYRFTYDLARLLNCDPTRVLVVSLSNGSLIANTVFAPVAANGGPITSGERSPMGLVSLLRALQQDTSSSLYASSFFKLIDREYMPEPIIVRKCPSDDQYRVFCPYMGTIEASSIAMLMFLFGVLIVALILAACCFAFWQLDTERKDKIDQDILDMVREDSRSVSAPLRLEYAQSWLEGRFMGEEWENARARQKRMLAIGN